MNKGKHVRTKKYVGKRVAPKKTCKCTKGGKCDCSKCKAVKFVCAGLGAAAVATCAVLFVKKK